jgi:hypothetical protein
MVVIADNRQARVDPVLFAFGVVTHILVSERRQLPGGIFRGMSGRVSTVNDDLGPFVR